MRKAIRWLNEKFSQIVLVIFYIFGILPIWILVRVVKVLPRKKTVVNWEKVNYTTKIEHLKSAY